jgi:cbb3-type cytochrome oxidase maturation protein
VSVIFILIAVSLLVAIGFLGLFIWSIKAGQYDDEYTPSVRMLFDDEVNILEDENSKLHPPAGGPNSKQIQNSKTKIQNPID